MAITTFAAIDVGSSEISMKIYEVSKKYEIKEINHLRHSMELGSETYRNKKISHKLINELCDVLIHFQKEMKEFHVSDYIAYGTSALREANNNLFVLDQIKLKADMKVKMISNSEQRFLSHKAIAMKEPDFQKIIQKGTLIVDVGSGSLQISLFDRSALLSTQNIRLGSLRTREELAKLENETNNLKDVISEFIDNDLLTYYHLFLQTQKVKHIIAVGEQLRYLIRYLSMEQPATLLNKGQYDKFYQSLSSKTIDEISRELHISRDQAFLVIPTAMIYEKIFSLTKADTMWLSPITLCDGIVAEYAEKNEKIVPSHNFIDDIITASRNIAQRYHCNSHHSKNVEYIALHVFDSLKKYHGLGKRERLLLQIAVILHNCGEYININEEAENSYKIVMSTEIIGLSHLERQIVANLLRYHITNFPEYIHLSHIFDRENYIKISRLSAILLLSNALDKSHKQKFTKIHCTCKENFLLITVDTLKDITLEKGLFEKKADFFEEVYGIRPILKQKRSV